MFGKNPLRALDGRKQGSEISCINGYISSVFPPMPTDDWFTQILLSLDHPVLQYLSTSTPDHSKLESNRFTVAREETE